MSPHFAIDLCQSLSIQDVARLKMQCKHNIGDALDGPGVRVHGMDRDSCITLPSRTLNDGIT